MGSWCSGGLRTQRETVEWEWRVGQLLLLAVADGPGSLAVISLLIELGRLTVCSS